MTRDQYATINVRAKQIEAIVASTGKKNNNALYSTGTLLFQNKQNIALTI